MEYNPEIHHRKSIRLKYYDYTTSGYYFITICTQNRENLFWYNNNGYNKCRGGACSAQIKLNNFGKIIQKEWINLKDRYSNVQLDEYIIMPNHFHGIIVLDQFNEKGRSKPRPYNRRYNLYI